MTNSGNTPKLISKLFDRLAFEKINGLMSINYISMLLSMFSKMYKKLNQPFEIDKDEIEYDTVGEKIEKYRNEIYDEYDLFDITFDASFYRVLNKLIYHMTLLPEQIKFDKNTISEIAKYHLDNERMCVIKEYGRLVNNPKLINWILDSANIDYEKPETIFDGNIKINSYIENIFDRMENKKVNIKLLKDKLFGCQMNPILKDLAYLNLYVRSGQNYMENIVHDDILRTDITTPVKMFDLILYDMPTDLHNMTHASCCKKIKNVKIRGTNAEALSIQLITRSLNECGRAIVTVPDTTIFGITEQLVKTRQYLVENYNLTKIVHIDDSFYYSKGLKNCILYFENRGILTTNIKISKIILDGESIKEIDIMILPVETIKKNRYSMHFKHYEEFMRKPNDKIKYDYVENVFNIYTDPTDVPNNKNMYALVLPSTYKNIDCVKKITADNATKYLEKTTFICQKNENEPIFFIDYLQNILRTKYEQFTKGKSLQYDINRIRDIRIPQISKSMNDTISEYVSYSQNIIDMNKNKIEYFKKMKNSVINLLQTDETIKLNDICVLVDPFRLKKQNNSDSNSDSNSESNNKITKINKIIGVIKNSLSAGQVYMLSDFEKASNNSHYFAVNSNDYLIDYIYYYLKHIEKNLLDIASLTDQPIMPQNKLFSIKIPKIDIDRQKELVDICSEINNNIDICNQETEKLKNKDIVSMMFKFQNI